MDSFLENLRQALYKDKIGLLNVEEVSEDGARMVFTVRSDLDCSGMENEGITLCQYDEGFITGVLYEYTHKNYSVIETECWANGSDACRFLTKMC